MFYAHIDTFLTEHEIIISFFINENKENEMIGIIKSFFVIWLLAFSLVAGAQTTEEIKQLAEQGDALGQAKLASLYLLGRNGVEENNEMAAKWMTKAAKQGLV